MADNTGLPNPEDVAESSGIGNDSLSKLYNATPEAIDTLVATGTINPQQGEFIKQNQMGARVRAEQDAQENAALQAQKETNYPQYLQDAQQGADTIENIAMQGTGIAPGYAPLQQQSAKSLQSTPQPLSPVGPQTAGLPSTLQPQAPEVIQAQEIEKATQEAAAQNAKELIAKEQARKQVETQQKMQERVAKVESEVKEDIEKSGSNLFKGIGDAIAIMLGAYSQGLTGGKENPGLKAVEARIDREVQARKYSAEQEAALRKLALDAANAQLDRAKFMTDNALKIAQIEKLRGETQKMYGDAVKGQEVTSLLQKPHLSREEVAALQLSGKEGRDMANSYVALPFDQNVYVRPIGSQEQVTKLKQFNADTGTIIPEIDEIMRVAQSPEFSKFSPKDRMMMQTKLSSLVGKLRIPFTGPGVLTDAEREMLFKTLGDPNTVFSMPSWEIAKLNQVRRIIRGGIKNAYKNLGGIDIGDAVGQDSAQNQRVSQIGGVPADKVEAARARLRARKNQQ